MASKSAVAFLMVNLALFAFVSANATTTCPDLNVCLEVFDGLLQVQLGSQSRTQCCELIKGIADVDLALCLCTSLKNTGLGGLVGGLLDPVTRLLASLTGSLLDKELVAVVNSCGLNNASQYKCPTVY